MWIAAALMLATVLVADVKAECIPCGDSGQSTTGDSNYDPGPATTPGSILVEYNYATGEFVVSVNEVNSWSFVSSGLFAGLDNQKTDLPTPPAFPRQLILLSDNPNVVGEATFANFLTYENVRVGPIFRKHLGRDDFIAALESGDFGIEIVSFTHGSYELAADDIDFASGDYCGASGRICFAIPEPSTLILLGVGAGGLVGYGWRRRQRQKGGA